MQSELRFDDKVVVITGAGGGLGRDYALMYAARGAKVVVNDLGGAASGGGASSNAADRVVAEIVAAGGTAVADYNSVEDGEKIIQTALDNFGTVDILVNNAGILRDVSFAKMTDADWDLVYRVHLRGTMTVTKAAWPIMRDKGYGRIVMTTSAAGIYGNFGQTNYSAMKLGLLGMANTLALEGASRNIRVNTIAPIAASRLTETVLPPEVLAGLKPEYVSPLVGWLTHEDCEETGSLFEVGAGVMVKLRWQRTKGARFRLPNPITIEDVATRWTKITDFTDGEFPATISESTVAALDNINNPPRGGNHLIDLDAADAAPAVVVENAYDERDVALYALGVGVGKNPTDPSDLKYVYELGENFAVLPTYGVIPALNSMVQTLIAGDGLPGLSSDAAGAVLHGEQFTEIMHPLPTKASLRHEIRLADALDKGRDAVAVVTVDSFDTDGEKVAHNEMRLFVRGAGGWGGDRGSSEDVNLPPDREPDAVIEEQVGNDQALLYRLSGDINPLHIDPEFARNFGFDRPILHGMCTFGYVGRHVVRSFLADDPARFKSIRVRLAKSVYPGDTLVTKMWRESENRVIVETRVKERDEIVIRNAAVEFYDQVPVRKKKSASPAATGTPRAVVTGPTSADVFAAIEQYFHANPEEVQAADTVFQFNVTDPDAVWTVDAKSGQVRQGAADKPDVTLTVSEENFLGMCLRGEDAQKMFFGGKLKIAGNMLAAAKLEFLKKMGSALIEEAVARRLAAAPDLVEPDALDEAASGAMDSEPTSADVFSAIGDYLTDHPDEARSAGMVFQFRLTDPESQWVVDAVNRQVQPGEAEKSDVALKLSDADFLAMCVEGQDAQKMFFAGKLKITGNIQAAGKLAFLTKIGPDAIRAKAAERAKNGTVAGAPTKGAAQTPRLATAPAIFAKMLDQYRAGAHQSTASSLLFKVSDPDATYLLDTQSGDARLIEGGQASDTGVPVVFISDEDVVALGDPSQSLEDMFQRGRIRVHGDLASARVTLEAMRNR